MGGVVEFFQKGSERCQDLKNYREHAMACATTHDKPPASGCRWITRSRSLERVRKSSGRRARC